MKKLAVLFALLGVVAVIGNATARENVGSLPGNMPTHVVRGGDTSPCGGSLLINADGSYENGYCWQYGGIVPPDYGAFAEGLNHSGTVCGAQFGFTQIGYYVGQTIDVYVYDSNGTNPTTVITATYGVNPGTIAFWPAISQNDVDITDASVSGDFFVGYWGNWPGAGCAFYIAADLNGFGGLPRTNIAPGIGYPTGWNDPSIIWGPTVSMGIGAWVDGTTPVQESTWGTIKHLYN